MNNPYSRVLLLVLALALLLALTACAGTTPATQPEQATAAQAHSGDPSPAPTDVPEEPPADAPAATETATGEPAPAGKDTLVVYFSATGTTKAVAEALAAVTGADLYEIKAAREYTDADLDWHDSSSRTTIEQNDPSFRPEIGSDPVCLEGYTTVYIGYPIWWGEEPRILDTFVETYDFDGITLIPFCTSGGSGIGRSGQNLAENAGSGTWLEGKRLGAGISEAELRDWIEGLN